MVIFSEFHLSECYVFSFSGALSILNQQHTCCFIDTPITFYGILESDQTYPLQQSWPSPAGRTVQRPLLLLQKKYVCTSPKAPGQEALS